MRHLAITVATGVLAVLMTAQPGEAQSRQTFTEQAGVSFLPARKPPRTEVSVHIGVWTLMEGGGEFGGRISRNRNEWFGIEYGLTYRPGAEVRKPSGLGLVNIRLAVPNPANAGILFVTAGVAAGNSANFSVSPMVGFGAAWTPPGGPDGSVMLRAELQFFPRGRKVDDRGRLLIAMVVPIGGRW